VVVMLDILRCSDESRVSGGVVDVISGRVNCWSVKLLEMKYDQRVPQAVIYDRRLEILQVSFPSCQTSTAISPPSVRQAPHEWEAFRKVAMMP